MDYYRHSLATQERGERVSGLQLWAWKVVGLSSCLSSCQHMALGCFVDQQVHRFVRVKEMAFDLADFGFWNAIKRKYERIRYMYPNS